MITFTENAPNNARVPRSPFAAGLSVVGLTATGELHEFVTVRWYGSPTAAAVACCVWLYPLRLPAPRSGAGRAAGSGYNRASAALEAALESAGITLAHPIGDRGERATQEALTAIAAALGARRVLIARHGEAWL